MTVVGFTLTKINVERKDSANGKISIKNNVSIKDVEKYSITLGDSKKEGLRFKFDFLTSYDVGNKTLATINILGDVLTIEKPDVLKSVLDLWKKDKKIDGKTMASVLNTALSKCNVQALLLSREMNLPSPIPLPRVNIKKK